LVYILSVGAKILIAGSGPGIRQTMNRKSKLEIAAPPSFRRPEDRGGATDSITGARTAKPPDQPSGSQAERKPIVSINGRDVDELPKSPGRAA
jgi:hypothetical protein